MSGTLFVVATPIGNLEDVTLRALRVLREVDLIAAEDTRRTARLLATHGIKTPSLSFHQHNLKSRVPQLVSRLQAGARIALVTDAGTPGISDPGAELVASCVEAKLHIEPVPGVSAPLVAAVASGFPLVPLTIFGFPPHRAKDRDLWLVELSTVRHTSTFFESPKRIDATLTAASAVLGKRQIVVARELTKVHQEFVRGTASEVRRQLTQQRGEVTVVVGPFEESESIQPFVTEARASAVATFVRLTNSGGFTRREALTMAARRYGLPSKVVYDAIEASKNSGE
jgi:16S rRNA (cytidine1402-2'-O)-methyltransferase